MKNKVTQAKITDLHFDDKNANKHTQKGLRLVEKSLSKLGAGRSILIDKNNNIIAGNGVIETAGQIGMENIRIVETDGKEIVAVKRTDIDINSKKGRELAIIDNHSAKESIDLDFDVINDLVSEYDISPVEWELESIDWNNEQEATEDNYEIPDKIETNIKRGDIFNIYKEGKLLHRVMCGDSTNSDDVAKLMNGEKADMILTDPPYNQNMNIQLRYPEKFTKSFVASADKIKDIINFKVSTIIDTINMLNINSIYIFSNKILIKDYLNLFDKYNYNILIWKKQSQTPLYSKDYLADIEYILYFFKDNYIWNLNNNFNNYYRLREVNSLKNQIHPTTKPIELFIPFIENSSNQHSIILDLFLGSGTTIIAAHQLGRRCYGMEIDEQYCQVILDRIKNLDNSIEIK